MVPFVSGQLGNLELALALARRSNLPGAEALVGQNFERLFAAGQYKEAAEAAAESPQARRYLPVHAGGQVWAFVSCRWHGAQQRASWAGSGVQAQGLGFRVQGSG